MTEPAETRPAAKAGPVRRLKAKLATYGPAMLLGVRWIQARLISVWGLLIAAWLCPPEVCTGFAIFTALANFVSIIVPLRFDAVFFRNSDPVALGRAFRLATATSAMVMTLIAATVLLLAETGLVLRGFGALFVIALGCRAALRLLLAEATAEGDFATIGAGNIAQAMLQPAMMLLLIWPLGPTTLAMLAADAFGHLVAALYVAWRRRAALWAMLAPRLWSLRELAASAGRWREAPLVLLPSTLLAFAFVLAPLLALPYAANAVLTAQLALAMRLLDMPTQMFGAVAVPMAMNTLRRHDGEARQARVRAVLLRLMLIAAAGLVPLGLLALLADPLLAGSKWAGLGVMTALLMPFFLGTALVGPLHEMGTIAQRPLRQMLINAVALAAAGAAILATGDLTLRLVLLLGLISLARMLAHARFVWTHVAATKPAGTRP